MDSFEVPYGKTWSRTRLYRPTDRLSVDSQSDSPQVNSFVIRTPRVIILFTMVIFTSILVSNKIGQKKSRKKCALAICYNFFGLDTLLLVIGRVYQIHYIHISQYFDYRQIFLIIPLSHRATTRLLNMCYTSGVVRETFTNRDLNAKT